MSTVTNVLIVKPFSMALVNYQQVLEAEIAELALKSKKTNTPSEKELIKWQIEAKEILIITIHQQQYITQCEQNLVKLRTNLLTTQQMAKHYRKDRERAVKESRIRVNAIRQAKYWKQQYKEEHNQPKYRVPPIISMQQLQDKLTKQEEKNKKLQDEVDRRHRELTLSDEALRKVSNTLQIIKVDLLLEREKLGATQIALDNAKKENRQLKEEVLYLKDVNQAQMDKQQWENADVDLIKDQATLELETIRQGFNEEREKYNIANEELRQELFDTQFERNKLRQEKQLFQQFLQTELLEAGLTQMQQEYEKLKEWQRIEVENQAACQDVMRQAFRKFYDQSQKDQAQIQELKQLNQEQTNLIPHIIRATAEKVLELNGDPQSKTESAESSTTLNPQAVPWHPNKSVITTTIESTDLALKDYDQVPTISQSTVSYAVSKIGNGKANPNSLRLETWV